jgi:hypothetical protein
MPYCKQIRARKVAAVRTLILGFDKEMENVESNMRESALKRENKIYFAPRYAVPPHTI